MELKIVNIVKENDYYIIKLNNDKYLRLGINELRYLMTKLECDSSIDISLDTTKNDISDNVKKLIDEKIEEYSNNKSRRFDGGVSMIKLVTINPDKFLNCIYKFCKYFFSLPSIIIYILLNILTFYLMGQGQNNKKIINDLSNLHINVTTIIILYISIIITLILHEIGHATVCKKYGGKVTKMGIVLFFLLPCMYCDVSDVYILNNKKRKLYVSAAGLYVNSFLSVVSILLYFSLNTSKAISDFLLFYYVANVGFVIYNLIPFVKLDGYWLLASILNINNLYIKSIICTLTAIFDNKLIKNINISNSKKNIMIIYGFCSLIFRPVFWTFTLISIRQQIMHSLNEYLINIGLVIVVFIVLVDLVKFYKELYVKYHTQRSSIINFL